MRILHVVTAFPRSEGDPITPWLVELLQRLRAEGGHDVEVFTSAYKGSPDQTFAGIPIHRFRYFFRRWENLTHEETAPDRMRRSLLYRVMPLFFVIAGILAIRRLVRRRTYDIIHVHWPVPLALFGWAAQRGGRPRRPPIVTTFYGAELRLGGGFRRFIAWAARRSARVIAISSYTSAALRAIVDVPVEVIPYAAALPPSSASPARAHGDATVLFVGRLVERKGVAHLIDALARLDDHSRLVVVGDGPERPRLEARARELGLADRVVFRGRISDAELQRAYQGADVFVLPAVVDSRGDTEGLGVVLLEAMNYGVPVVASNIGGIVDIVVDRETGILVPPADPVALAGALQTVLGDPSRARELGEAGRRRLAEHFSWVASLSQLDGVYRGVR
jgi:glycosyltransferase involved in cell wall biosynthesis